MSSVTRAFSLELHTSPMWLVADARKVPLPKVPEVLRMPTVPRCDGFAQTTRLGCGASSGKAGASLPKARKRRR
jgi:hypothetical protein